MKILVVHPGASVSTHDVFVGLVAGLRHHGHEVLEYALDSRIERAGAFMHHVWHKASRKAHGGEALRKPSTADILYQAGCELVTRALRVQPDVTLIVSAMYIHPDVVVLMRRAGLKTAVLFTESPYDDEAQRRLVPFVDVAWTNERSSARNLEIGYLPHAWTPGIHDVDSEDAPEFPTHDVVFVGTGFEDRAEILGAVDWDGLNFGLYGSWENLGSRNALRKHLRGGYVPNESVAQLYRRARIGLNLYRKTKGFAKGAPRIEHAESLNPRAYELAALGCFTISDARDEVSEVFGGLVPTFTRPEELRPLIDRWLADPAGRDRVREQLPAAVAAHNWYSRAADIIRDLLGSGIGASQASPAATRVAAGG